MLSIEFLVVMVKLEYWVLRNFQLNFVLELKLIVEKTTIFYLMSGEWNFSPICSQAIFQFCWDLKQVFYEDIISAVGRDHQAKSFLEINHFVFIYPVTEVPSWTEN